MDELEMLEQQVGMMPEGQQMSPSQMQPASVDMGMDQGQPSFSEGEKQEAIQALQQIQQMVEQMIANGASEEEINQFLQELGLTLEDLQFLEEALMSEEIMGQAIGQV
jgi:hypothetical protein|tara:strand:+ start:1193 stop:1516 length:324 start_codon:yes stop_codon:yes gene_type:complete